MVDEGLCVCARVFVCGESKKQTKDMRESPGATVPMLRRKKKMFRQFDLCENFFFESKPISLILCVLWWWWSGGRAVKEEEWVKTQL